MLHAETERCVNTARAARETAESHEEDLQVWRSVAALHETTLKSARRMLMTGQPLSTTSWRDNKRAEEAAVAHEVILESARVSQRREELMKRKVGLVRAQHEAAFKELEAEIARNEEKKRLEGLTLQLEEEERHRQEVEAAKSQQEKSFADDKAALKTLLQREREKAIAKAEALKAARKEADALRAKKKEEETAKASARRKEEQAEKARMAQQLAERGKLDGAIELARKQEQVWKEAECVVIRHQAAWEAERQRAAFASHEPRNELLDKLHNAQQLAEAAKVTAMNTAADVASMRRQLGYATPKEGKTKEGSAP